MMEERDYVAVLIGKHLDNSLNAGERATLEAWLNASENNRALFEQINDQQELTANLKRFYAYDADRISRRISEHIPEFAAPSAPSVYRMLPYRKWGWAAAVALLLGGSTYYLINYKKAPVAIQASIAPGTQGAILTLANGREVVLDTIASGIIAHQNGSSLVMSNGKLAYNPAGENSADIEYNKMTTPRGRQFQMTLPDGTRVWLNAGSTIRYPTTFDGDERRVEVSGEVCFEVVKDATKPFLVNVNNSKASIAVLGTMFNISAYENESAIYTTLLDGSVKVETPSAVHSASIILKTGQQAMIANSIGAQAPTGKLTLVNNPDLEKIMAWKNGLFNFEGADLEEVMRQLERWYNIDVVYENGIPDIKFMGEMSRQIPLADLLEILRRTEVDFRVEGRKLIVLNK